MLVPKSRMDIPVEAPEGTMARWRPVSVTTSTSTVGLPRESYTERAWILEIGILKDRLIFSQLKERKNETGTGQIYGKAV
jgi:hypothetical protein